MDYIHLVIIKTLVYGGFFSYPLYSHQIWRYLITHRRISKRKVELEISNLVNHGQVIRERGKKLYALKGKKKLFRIRQKRNRQSKKKLLLAKRFISISKVKYLPTIQLIGISGGLAIGNAKRGDDIDFFVITSSGSLWLTRLLMIILFEFIGVRRRPGERRVNNKVCLNMMVDCDHLQIPFRERDIFSAHEVVQMRPIFTRGDIYNRFLWKNRWVKEFMANSIGRIKNDESKIKEKTNYLLFLPELIAKKLQLWYMRKRKKTEIIKDGYLRFHPKDTRKMVLPRFNWWINQVEKEIKKRESIPLPFPALEEAF